MPQGLENEDKLRDVLRSIWMSIKDFFKCHKIMDVMNVCLLTANENDQYSEVNFRRIHESFERNSLESQG